MGWWGSILSGRVMQVSLIYTDIYDIFQYTLYFYTCLFSLHLCPTPSIAYTNLSLQKHVYLYWTRMIKCLAGVICTCRAVQTTKKYAKFNITPEASIEIIPELRSRLLYNPPTSREIPELWKVWKNNCQGTFL